MSITRAWIHSVLIWKAAETDCYIIVKKVAVTKLYETVKYILLFKTSRGQAQIRHYHSLRPTDPNTTNKNGKPLARWIKSNFHFNIARFEYPRAFKRRKTETKIAGWLRRVISPFNGGSLTISRLSLTLNDEELCRFSFLIIDGPFAYCLSLTAWLGGCATGWDFGLACMRGRSKIKCQAYFEKKSSEKYVNTHPSKQYPSSLNEVWFDSNHKGFDKTKAKFSAHLIDNSFPVFFIRLFSTSPSLWTLLFTERSTRDRSIDLSFMIKMLWSQRSSASCREKKRVLQRLNTLPSLSSLYLALSWSI